MAAAGGKLPPRAEEGKGVVAVAIVVGYGAFCAVVLGACVAYSLREERRREEEPC